MFPSDEWLRDRAGVHRSTAARWRQARAVPPAVARLAELELEGRLELIHTDWQQWRLDARTGELVTPNGYRLRAGELLALPLHGQLRRALIRENNALRRAIRDPRRWVRLVLLRLARRVLGRRRQMPRS